ncbi:hypothetical protein [Stutzerimonas xanthomarina]|uniref:hypothetical protein n=1 Tax=Stutzerimonas xanthomarina TaxID=271420 RepID=UPI003AA7FADB
MKRRDSNRGRFITSVQSSVETAFARLLESAINVIPRVLAALLTLLLFAFAQIRWVRVRPEGNAAECSSQPLRAMGWMTPEPRQAHGGRV